MKTHSSLSGVAAAFAAATLLLHPAGLSADTGAEVFARNRESVLATRRTVVEGVVFCVGRAVSEECLGAAVGFGKAKSLAWKHADRFLFDTADWPDDTTEEERRAAWGLLPSRDISGGEDIFEDHPEPDRWLVVLAIPETALTAAKPTPAAVENALVEARRRLASVAVSSASSTQKTDPAFSSSDPRGLWEEDGVTANETMSDGQF